MFVRVPALCMSVAFAVCASAASVSVRNGVSGSPAPGNSCDANTGTQQCCNSLAEPTDSAVTKLIGLLGIVLEPIDALVGLTCTPIVGTAGCNSQAACCTGNTFEGLITVGCSPINIGL